MATAYCSTRPRNPEGKAATARDGTNSTSHGLCSKELLILDGQEQQLPDFMTALHDALQPVGAVELDLFAQHAHASWNLRRCRLGAQMPATRIENPPERPVLVNPVQFLSQTAAAAFAAGGTR